MLIFTLLVYCHYRNKVAISKTICHNQKQHLLFDNVLTMCPCKMFLQSSRRIENGRGYIHGCRVGVHVSKSLLRGGRSRGSAKSAINTAAGCQHKIAIFTAAVPKPIQIYTRLPCVHIQWLFTRQPFKSQIDHIHFCRVYTKIVIYTAAVQEPNRLYTAAIF